MLFVLLTVSVHLFPVALPRLPLTHLHAFALGRSQIKYLINVLLLKALLQVLETPHTAASECHSLTQSHYSWNGSNRPALSFIHPIKMMVLTLGRWQNGCIERVVTTNKQGVKQPVVLLHICLTIFHFKVSVWDWGLPTVTSQDEINLEKINTSVLNLHVNSEICCFYFDQRWKQG